MSGCCEKVTMLRLIRQEKDVDLLSNVMVAALTSYGSDDELHKIDNLYRVIENPENDPISRINARRALLSIIEELEIPLKVNDVHYLTPGISGLEMARKFLENFNKDNDFNDYTLLKIFSSFTVGAVSHAMGDNKHAFPDQKYQEILAEIVGDCNQDLSVGEKFNAIEELIYYLACSFICLGTITKAFNVKDAKVLLRLQSLILSLRKSINLSLAQRKKSFEKITQELDNLIAMLGKKVAEFKRFEIIKLLEEKMIQAVIKDIRYRRVLKDGIAKDSKDNSVDDVFSTKIVDLLYRTPALGSIRSDLKEIVGDHELNDKSVKNLVKRCCEIVHAQKERRIQEANENTSHHLMH